MTSYRIIAILSTFSALPALIIYWNTRKSQDDYMKYVALLLLFSMLSDVVGMMGALKLIKLPLGGNAIFQIYQISTIILISLLYKQLFPKPLARLFDVIIILLLVIFCFIFYSLDAKENTSIGNVPETIVFIIFTLAYFFRLMTKMPTLHVNQLPMFWINTGLLIYYAGALVIFLFSGYLINILKDNMIVYWSFHNFLNIISHLLIAIGLWQVKHKVKSL